LKSFVESDDHCTRCATISLMPATYRAVTVWFTGLPRSGKTTLSQLLAQKLRELGVDRIEILDGDVVRRTLSAGLGYSKADRDENVRRIAAHANAATRSGAVCIVAAISPYAAARAAARNLIGEFVEVYCAAPLEVCVARDTTGLYERALVGAIASFTGVSDPYEAPDHPDVRLDTAGCAPEVLADEVIRTLEALGYLRAPDRAGQPRLETLGSAQ
jgi:adenylyl-sulfate kinase